MRDQANEPRSLSDWEDGLAPALLLILKLRVRNFTAAPITGCHLSNYTAL